MQGIPTFSGSSMQIGAAYARAFQREIAGFFSQEFGAYKYSKPFVKACLEVMTREAPLAAQFIKGAAQGSFLSVEEHTLLMLHEEELYHRRLNNKIPHCTAVGAVAKSGQSRGALIGQNWDWNTSYYPWASINRIAVKGLPRFVSLSYPGLPVCAGLNSAGLSLMWTGAGYYPPLVPGVGVPTYAILFEILLRKDVAGALNYLKRVQNAGAFILLLGDRRGELAVVEAVPGKKFVELCDSACRVNVYESPGAVTASRQRLPSAGKCHSLKRKALLERMSLEPSVKLGLRRLQEILSQPEILIERSHSHATLMQLVADCGQGELRIRAWRQKGMPWISLKV